MAVTILPLVEVFDLANGKYLASPSATYDILLGCPKAEEAKNKVTVGVKHSGAGSFFIMVAILRTLRAPLPGFN